MLLMLLLFLLSPDSQNSLWSGVGSSRSLRAADHGQSETRASRRWDYDWVDCVPTSSEVSVAGVDSRCDDRTRSTPSTSRSPCQSECVQANRPRAKSASQSPIARVSFESGCAGADSVACCFARERLFQHRATDAETCLRASGSQRGSTASLLGSHTDTDEDFIMSALDRTRLELRFVRTC